MAVLKGSVLFPVLADRALQNDHMPKRIPIHKPLGSNTEHARQRVVNSKRAGSRSVLGYGRLWQRIRKAQLCMHPLCVFCLEQGLHTPADQVDHIDGCAFNNSNSNLRSLCRSCHSRRTATDQSFGRRALAIS